LLLPILTYRGNAKIWTIKSDGTGLHQVTNPGPSESDDNGHDFYSGGKMIIFSRYNSTTQRRDLYSIYFTGTQNFQQITNTPNIDESLPVISHNGKLLAYRAFYYNPYKDAIRVVNVGSWTLVTEMVMQPPADKNIWGIDFSRKDDRLFVAIESSDVPGTTINKKVEIFSIKLDGSDQERLTNNETPDYWPSTIPLLW
jgi:Tol biopolymer transport system component